MRVFLFVLTLYNLIYLTKTNCGEIMKRKALIVCKSTNVNKIFNAFKKSKKFRIVNIFSDYLDFEKSKDVDSIFVDANIDKDLLYKIERFSLSSNIEFNVIANSINIRKTKINCIDDLCFLNFKQFRISKFQSFIKRTFDVIFSSLFIILSLPLFIVLILLIKIFVKGPIFYLQKRITKDEKEFVIYKFRTMRVDAEKETGAVLSFADDQRLTRLGKFLRKYALDEIPQIFNVLLGDMSIVGPRPERKIFIGKYKRINEYYKYRFNVKAGITGYAQIYAKYDSSYKVKLDYELYYISNYSLVNDIKIIINTIIHLITREKLKNTKHKEKKIVIKESWK